MITLVDSDHFYKLVFLIRNYLNMEICLVMQNDPKPAFSLT